MNRAAAAAPVAQTVCAPPPPSSASAKPDFDALAASFGALSVAIAVGSAIVGVLAILTTIAWNRTTKAAAIAAARDEAERRVVAFLREEAPERVDRITREHLAANVTSAGVVSIASSHRTEDGPDASTNG